MEAWGRSGWVLVWGLGFWRSALAFAMALD